VIHPDHHRAQTIDGSRDSSIGCGIHPAGIAHAPTREGKIITISKQAASTKKAQRKAPKLQCEQDFVVGSFYLSGSCMNLFKGRTF
jgi:hypothetical protein